MARRPSLFRLNDWKRAVRAARNAGLDPTAVEVDRDGTIRVILAKKGEQVDTPENLIDQL